MFHALLILLLAALTSVPAHAQVNEEEAFQSWLAGFKNQAMAAGISAGTLAAIDVIEFQPQVIELDQQQPESRLTLPEYLEKTVNPARIKKGREMMHEHRTLLRRTSAKYGVPPQIIVALWGKESNYGQFTGGMNVLDALATLAFEGRRATYFRAELLQALRIIDAGHTTADDMNGSWAGAMGQCQFMPTSFFKYGADGDGDGRIDIWNNEADVFASAANYLAKEGWQGAEPWGREVRLTQRIPESGMGRTVRRSVVHWRSKGVRLADGEPLPTTPAVASLVQPDGLEPHDAYLVYSNFNVLMHWNRSVYFGIGVGTLADAIE